MKNIILFLFLLATARAADSTQLNPGGSSFTFGSTTVTVGGGRLVLTGQPSSPASTDAMTLAMVDTRGGYWKTGYSTAAETVTNSSTYVSSTSVSIVLEPGTWFIEAHLIANISATSQGGSKLNFRFTGTLSSSSVAQMAVGVADVTPLGGAPGFRQTSTLPLSFNSGAGSVICAYSGRIVVSAQGTLEAQVAQNSAVSGHSASLAAGSFVRAHKLP